MNRGITIFLIFTFPFIIFSQSEKIIIPYKSTLPIEITYGLYDFVLESKSKRQYFSDEELMKFRFDTPGRYILLPMLLETQHLHENHSHENCSDIHLQDTIIIEVLDYRIDFLGKEINSSKPIFCGEEQKGNSISMQAKIETFENKEILLTAMKMQTAGIETNITGTSEPQKVRSGEIQIKYNLSGRCELSTYIQYDFFDNAGVAYSISPQKMVLKK